MSRRRSCLHCAFSTSISSLPPCLSLLTGILSIFLVHAEAKLVVCFRKSSTSSERSQNPHFSRDDTKQRAFVTGWAPESVVNRLRLADLASSGLSLCIYCPSGLDSCGWVRCLQCNGCAFDDSQTPLATVFSASDRQRRDDIAASSAPPISLPANAASTRLRCHCPHRPSDCRVFVTCLNAGELPFYLAGGADVLDKQFNGFRAYCSRSFVDGVLAHMSYVTVVDMEWGRKELLWKTLHNALEG